MVEPATPGTEQESSQQAAEQERLLSVKAYLDDGSYGQVFEHIFVNGTEYWYCNLCRCPVMGKVYNHEIGKRHNNKLTWWKSKSTGQFSSPQTSMNEADEDRREEKTSAAIEIVPGQPAPPGFENEMGKVAQIQERLNGYNVGPLVGLEYVLELQDFYGNEAKYLCVLCNKKGDSGIVLSHVAGYNHVFQYLHKHFPSVHHVLAPYNDKPYWHNWRNCIAKIADAIERRFGRLKPMTVEADKFEKNRPFYLEKIAQSKHFQETPTLTFRELVNKEELTKTYDEPSGGTDLFSRRDRPQQQATKCPSPPAVQRPTRGESRQPQTASGVSVSHRRKSLSPAYSISSDDDEPDKRKNVGGQGKRRGTSRRSPSSSRSRSRSPFNRRRSPSPQRSASGGRDNRSVRRESGTTSQERTDYVKKPSVDNTQQIKRNRRMNEQMEKFKKLSKAIENEMERVLKQHRENPEKHPQYNEEWKKFWNKRHKQLQLEGKDISKHGFIAEWIPFWSKRMKELHDEEVKTKKAALQQRLGIPVQVTPIKFRIGGFSESIEEKTDKNTSVSHRPMYPGSGSDSDKEDSWKYKRSHSPGGASGNEEPAAKQRNMAGKDQSLWEMIGSHNRESTSAERWEDDDSSINIIPVLRLLTAFEEKLGSLGPKVNDLLVQALVIEKAETNGSAKLLDDDINCVLLETAKERLKGQILAGLVDNVQEPAYNRAITKTESLIEMVNARNTKPDKAAMAREVANMLVMQGKTNVTQRQMEPFMNAMLKMAEASQESDKPLTTADFLNRVSGSGSSSKSITKPIKTDKTSSTLEISDSDLQTLLQTFKYLSTEEQESVIDYMRTLEAKEPERVEKLKKFVNLGDSPPPKKYNEVNPYSAKGGKPVPKTVEVKDENEKSATDTLTLIANLLNNFSNPTSGSPSTSAADLTKKLSGLLNNPGLNKPSPGLDKPAAAFTKPPPAFTKPPPTIDEPPPFYKPPPDFDRPVPRFDKQSQGFNRLRPLLDTPTGVIRPTPPFNKQLLDILRLAAPAFNRPAPPFNAPGPPFNRPAPPFNRPAPLFNRPIPPFNRPPGFNRPGPPFNRPAQAFNRQPSGLKKPAPAAKKPAAGIDLPPVPGLDEPDPDPESSNDKSGSESQPKNDQKNTEKNPNGLEKKPYTKRKCNSSGKWSRY